MNLQEYLKKMDAVYDPELRMVGSVLVYPGYHTTLKNGAWVHATRDTVEYALALLREGSSVRLERARGIIEKALSLQDCDPVSPTYGIWSWFVEEPLSQMSPPDWNWADFMGLFLAEIIKEHGEQVTDLRNDILKALYHAAGSIYRRNIHPGYTNISVLGGITTSLLGEILGEERITSYGLRRLTQCVDHFEHHGGFTEYNSPTYTMSVLRDCESGLRLLSNADARKMVRILLHAAWWTIADHFHPATSQWAGPHSRSYSTFLLPMVAGLLESKTGIPVSSHPLERSGHSAKVSLDDLPGPECSPELLKRFHTLPQTTPFQIRKRFIRRETDETSTWGTTWFSTEACLGSVNHDFIWDQRRSVQAYWNGLSGSPVSLRMRFLRDGKEFASVFVCNVQDGPRVLTAIHLLLDRGVFHPVWYAPKENIFDMEDLRLRFELKGEQVEALKAGSGEFLLRSGGWQTKLSAVPGSFGGSALSWEMTRGENVVAVDAICYHGARKKFPFTELRPVIIAAGLHLQKLDEVASVEKLEIEHDAESGLVRSRYGYLTLTVPDHAVPLPYPE